MSHIEIINLPARFDYSIHRQFDEQCIKIIANEKCKEIILDFSDVEYLDSAAIGMIVLLQKRAATQDKVVKISGVHGNTADVLNMAHMKKIFEFI